MAISALGLTIQNLVSVTTNRFNDYLTDMNNYAALRLKEGDFDYGLLSPDYTFPPDFIDEDNLDLKTTQLYSVDDIVNPFPVYVPPEPLNIDDLWGNVEPHVERVWVSTELDTLIDLVEKMASGDSSWFSATYQIKAFDSDRDRRLQTLDDSLRLVAAKHAARGFRLPTSMLHAQENELIQKYQFDLTNLSREITKVVEEAARDFMKYGVESGLKYEEINMAFTTAYDKLFLEKAVAITEAFLKNVEATVKVFEAEVRTVLARLEAEKAAWELTGEYNKIQMEASLYPIKKYTALVDAAVAKGQLEFQTWAKKVDADYNALSTGMTTASDTIKSAMAADVNITTSKG